MPGLLKQYGEVMMKEAQSSVEDAVVGEPEGVRVYERRNRAGRPPSLNGTHRKRKPIERIAGRLHGLGYAVKIEWFVLGPVHHYDFEAVWPGPDGPPPPPFV